MRHDPVHALVRMGLVVTALVALPLAAVAVETIAAPAPKAAEAAERPDSRDGRCDVCGSCSCVRKVCVPKPKEREIKKVCWSYKCEDVCIPGPSEYCGRKCGTKDECGCWSFDVWKPTCADVRTKKVPVKTEVKRKVPGVEWSPEERCVACRRRKPDGTWPAASPTP